MRKRFVKHFQLSAKIYKMKKIIAILVVFLVMGCQKKIVKIGDSSIYNIPSQWETPTGNKIKLDELKGKVVTLVMVYTSCKTACPRLTQDMKDIEAKVGHNNADDLRYVFVSIDPEHDTPEKMSEFMTRNKLEGKQWLFLRGDEEDTKDFANVVAMKYKKISPMEFTHSNIISVFSKTGDLVYQKEGVSIDINGTADQIKNQLKIN